MTHRPLRHIQYLVEQIGPRPIGSSHNHQAAMYITQQFEARGLMQDCQSFEFAAWIDESIRLYVDGQRLVAHANTFSRACNLAAPFTAACTLTELAGLDMAGKIIMLYGDLTTEIIWPKNNPITLPDHHRRLFELLEAGQPAAVLMVSPQRGDTVSRLEDADFITPSATIPPESALALFDHPDETVHLSIKAHWKTNNSGAHVIGRKPGNGAGKIIVCAHFDTKVNTPGAVDNAAGISTLLGVAEALAGREFAPTLEFVAFNNEEYYGCSTQLTTCYDSYFASLQPTESIIAAINLDGVGQRLGTNTVTLMANSQAFSDLLDEIHRDFPAIQRVDPWYESNHTLFAMRGIPAVALTSIGLTNLMHLPDDTAKWVSPAKLEEATALTVRLIEALAAQSPAWTRA